MIRIACIAAALVGIGAVDALACSVPLIRTLHNQTVDGTMAARSGKPCSIRMQFTSGTSERVAVAQRPAHGTLTAAGQRVTYVSRPGYTASDSFTYQRHGKDKWGGSSVKTVRVAVTVR
jgi:hypothetical protein